MKKKKRGGFFEVIKQNIEVENVCKVKKKFKHNTTLCAQYGYFMTLFRFLSLSYTYAILSNILNFD